MSNMSSYWSSVRYIPAVVSCDVNLLCEMLSVPYAWDEPTALPHITLKVQSGTCATYDMNTVGDGERLYYENFIYIAFTHTFKRYSRIIISLCLIKVTAIPKRLLLGTGLTGSNYKKMCCLNKNRVCVHAKYSFMSEILAKKLRRENGCPI